ncbi:transaldolase [Actinomadura flavalba]|uniref:transaldolase n=1 Tax=Actinomadura flavalba TaxID=1120938 RepID=UPI000375AD2A|nr:transaldolase [Actinomadura flavalba]
MSNRNTARLAERGVSLYLDDISRKRLESGNLTDLISTYNVTGVTTNPSIFSAALTETDDYEDRLRLMGGIGVTGPEAVRMLTVMDVRQAADLLEPVYRSTGGRDGWVSIEVDPRYARDTARTVAEGRLLSWLVSRPNVMVKVPSTTEGLPAITELVARGISVNATVIISLDRYREVIDAYLTGLERAVAAGTDPSQISSVASFYISRLDRAVDELLEQADSPEAERLRGQTAIANARLAHQIYRETMDSPRWRILADRGARPQRLLWASTAVKDDRFHKARYVTALAIPGTINTMPAHTLDAVATHGGPLSRPADEHYATSRDLVDKLAEFGISYEEIARSLEQQGIDGFVADWEELHRRIGKVFQEYENAAPAL